MTSSWNLLPRKLSALLCTALLAAGAQAAPFKARDVASIIGGPDGMLYASADTAAFRSKDKGRTWDLIVPRETASWTPPLALSPQGVLFAGVGDGVSKSIDHGSTWTPVGTAFLRQREGMSGVLGLFHAGGRLYAAFNGLAMSADDGAHWVQLNRKFEAPQVLSLPDGTLLSSQPDGLHESKDQGKRWTRRAMPGLPTSLLAHPGGKLFVGIMGGAPGSSIMSSADKGKTWIPASTGLPLRGDDQVRGLQVSRNGSLYGAVENVVFASHDRGASWKAAGEPLPNTKGRSLIWSLFVADDGALYAGTRDAIWKSSDHGATWSKSLSLDTGLDAY